LLLIWQAHYCAACSHFESQHSVCATCTALQCSFERWLGFNRT
jgi:hypothetical protein